jgi:hypothetical protein
MGFAQNSIDWILLRNPIGSAGMLKLRMADLIEFDYPHVARWHPFAIAPGSGVGAWLQTSLTFVQRNRYGVPFQR